MSGISWQRFIDRLMNDFGKTPAEIEAAIRACDREGMPPEEIEGAVQLLRQMASRRGQG